MNSRLARRSFFVLLATLALGACGKVTAENYGKIKVGQSYAEVAAILGSPAGCDDVGGLRSCKWTAGGSSISVKFAADKVVLHTAENVH